MHRRLRVTPVAGTFVDFHRVRPKLVADAALDLRLVDHVHEVTTGTGNGLFRFLVEVTRATPLQVRLPVPN